MRSRFEVVLLACPGLQEYSETSTMIEHADHVIAVTPCRQLSRTRFASFAEAVEDHHGKLSGLLLSSSERLRASRHEEPSASRLRVTSAR
jgi:hypothetical protein